MPGTRTTLPVGTISVLLCWAVCTTLYHLGARGLFLAVRRDPDALAAGQVWRVLSPVLVQPDDVPVVIGLGVLAAMIGVAAERMFGTTRFAVLFLAGALAGHIIGEWWQPYSGGISVGFCGPLGAIVVYAILSHLRRPGPQLVGPSVVLIGAVVLTVMADIHGSAILAGALVGVVAMRPVSGT